MSKEPLYFGCLYRPGHYVFRLKDGGLDSLGYDRNYRWIVALDGILPPPQAHQVEGQATLSYVQGYSIIAFWDHSVDTRSNSNSVFLIPGKLEFDEVLGEARRMFPMIFERFEFEIMQHVEEAD